MGFVNRQQCKPFRQRKSGSKNVVPEADYQNATDPKGRMFIEMFLRNLNTT